MNSEEARSFALKRSTSRPLSANEMARMMALREKDCRSLEEEAEMTTLITRHVSTEIDVQMIQNIFLPDEDKHDHLQDAIDALTKRQRR